MSKPASSLADVQSLAARCVEMADPQLDADFEAKFGQAPAVFAALPAEAQQAHLPQENAVESAPADLRVASDEVKLSLSTAEVDLIRHALETHRDLLASPTSADRDANGGDWADKQVHACDTLLVALSAPTKAQTNYTGGEVARQQDDNHRRAALQKLQREKIGVADLVLATDSLNPQIKVAIGTFEGTSKGGNVQLRLLHVLRAWGNDGHHRPDAHLIQALYSGLGNYSDFKSDSVRKIAKADVPFLIGQSEHQLLERIQSAAVVPPTSDDSLSPGM